MENLDPVLFRISDNEHDGRHLVALRDLEAGELIFSEQPVALGPGDVQGVCICCCNPTSLVCNKCWWPVCSRCVSTSMHKGECRILSSCTAGVDGTLPQQHLLPLRALFLQKNTRVWDQVAGLRDHGIQSVPLPTEQLLQDAGFRDFSNFVRDECGLSVDETTLVTVYVSTLSSAILSRDGDRSVAGLYLQGGLLTHSCIQNTRIIIKGKSTKMYVYASVPIKKGEKMTYCRVPQVVSTGTIERRSLLARSFIDCHCKRCCDPSECGAHTSSIFCQRCEGVCVPMNPLDSQCCWQCVECDEKISGQFTSTLLLGIKEGTRTFKGSRSERYRAFRDENRRILCSNHYLQTAERAKFFLQFSSDASVEDTMQRVAAGRELLDLVDILDPGLSIFRESILVNLGTSLQLMLTEEIVRRQTEDDEFLEDAQVYAAFRDAQFCFKEARLAAVLSEDPDNPVNQPTASLDENLSILAEMREYFDNLTS